MQECKAALGGARYKRLTELDQICKLIISLIISESVEATSSSRRTREKGYPTFEADEHLSFHLLHYQDNEGKKNFELFD